MSERPWATMSAKEFAERYASKHRWRRFIGWVWTAEGYLNPRRRYRAIKWFIQRGRRGWADCDTWDLDTYLARVIAESVDRLRQYTVSMPVGTTPARWDRKLRRIAAAYQRHLDRSESLTFAVDSHDEAQRHEMGLLIRHFPGLWD